MKRKNSARADLDKWKRNSLETHGSDLVTVADGVEAHDTCSDVFERFSSRKVELNAIERLLNDDVQVQIEAPELVHC